MNVYWTDPKSQICHSRHVLPVCHCIDSFPRLEIEYQYTTHVDNWQYCNNEYDGRVLYMIVITLSEATLNNIAIILDVESTI